MARIYRRIGSLIQLIDELEREGIGTFRTMDDIRSFHNNCESSLNRIREEYHEIVRQEVVDLESEYRRLSLKLDQKIREREALLHNELEDLKGILAGNERRNVLMRFLFFFRKKRW